MGFEGEAKSATKNDFVLDQSSPSSGGNTALSGFEDKRGVAISRMKIAQLAKNYADDTNTAQLKATAENFGGQRQAPIQRQGKSNLPDNIKSGVENLSGIAMDDVSVHYNSDKPATVQAHAYAQGTDIHVAPGQEKHLPHEAWHVVQQKQGRVKPTKQLKKKVPINDDEGLEREADVMGAKAIQGKFEKPTLLQRVANVFSSKKTAQLVLEEGGEWAMEPFEEVVKSKDDAEDHLHLFIFHEDRLVTYLENFNKYLDELIKFDLSDSKKASENLKTLYRLEVLSTFLNGAGVVLGLSAIGVFSAATAGLGPAAVGIAALGTIATTMETGLIASAIGLATDSAKEYVKSKDVDKSLKPGQDTFKELALNGLGNDVAGGAAAIGKSAGMEGGAKSLGGVVAAQLGGIFAAIGLYGNKKAFSEMAKARKSIASDFLAFSETLNVLKSELIMKSSELQGTAHSSQISEEDQIRIVEMVGTSTSKIDSALKSIHKSLGAVKKSPDLASK